MSFAGPIGARATGDGLGEVIHRLAWPQSLRRPDFRLSDLAHDRSFGPCADQAKKEPLLFLGFGLGDPKKGLFGILPELTGL
jgi:hypothetical protein